MKFKRIVSIITVGVLAISCMLTVEAAETENKIFSEIAPLSESETVYEYKEYGDGTITITKYKGEGGDVVIPDKIDGKKVTGIGDFAFANCKSLTAVKIPNGVTSIGNEAFSSCSHLTSVDLPEGLECIGNHAFLQCALTSLDIPAAVTNIGFQAFYYNPPMSTINVDKMNEKYLSIDNVLFSKDKMCLILYPMGKTNENYAIPNTVRFIDTSAFSCNFFLTSVEIPDSVIEIGDSAFMACTKLKSVEISANVTSIGENTFAQCALSSIIVDEKNANYLSTDGVLFNKNKTTLIQYPSMKEGEKYTIPDSVTRMAQFAFANCNLVSIEIPAALNSIGRWTFQNCRSLTNFVVDEANEKYTAVDGILYNKDKTILLQYTLGKKTDNYIIPSGTKLVGADAFLHCSLTSVIIPEGVTTLEDSAFGYCNSLAAIAIPDSVTSIGTYTFVNHTDYLVIYGNMGSYAETYANENNIPFKSIEEFPAIDTPSEKPVIGDLDNDGITTTNDALVVLQASFNSTALTEEQLAIADVDGDGELTVNDAYLIIKSSFDAQ